MITATLQSYRKSPRKVRLVSGLVKGKSVEQALQVLKVLTKDAALPLCKLLESAVQNAKNVHGIEVKDLFVKEFSVNAGTTMKRSMPRARGSAFPILKRTSHITLVLGEREGVKSEQPKGKSKKL
ncbi:MAG: 50S ribosomal protein L22 [Candidatus Taylorbacteria bacterium]|nr:50S ribosomal protein L22 [Candidatus Taylorbacteria bacterium]